MKPLHRRTVVAIDDDEINLNILSKCAKDAGFTVESFDTSLAGWEHLRNHPREVDIVLLDKMMPDMNGIELLKKIKMDKNVQHVPVILQTGDVGVNQMREGLENGAYYYHTKPFHPEILTAILQSAATECATREELLSQMSETQSRFVSLMQEGCFTVRSHQDASLLAASLSQSALYPEFVAVGLLELLTNAIEHGNLEFGFEKKSHCLINKTWASELEARLRDPVLGSRVVQVYAQRRPDGLHIVIKDQGRGFDWKSYVYADRPPGGLTDPNGRGISKALVMLDSMQYAGLGNEVHCHIPLASILN